MRSLGFWNGRVAAAASFYGLVALAAGVLAGLGGLVLYHEPVYELCRSTWGALGMWLPALVAGGSVVLAGTALVHQWWATRRLLGWLAGQRVAVPPRLARLADRVGLGGRIDCIAGGMVTPFCYGFLRPRVCVPLELLDLLDDQELTAVLRHEAHHVNNREPLKIWLSRALARGLFFLPLARELRDSYLTAKELAADETTVAGGEGELPLASALIKMLSLDAQITVDPVAAIGGLVATSVALLAQDAAGSATEARIRRLLDRQAFRPALPSLTSVVLSLLVVVAIFAVSYTGLAASSAAPYDECAPQTTSLSVPAAAPVEPLAIEPVLTVTPLPMAEFVESLGQSGVVQECGGWNLDCSAQELAIDLWQAGGCSDPVGEPWLTAGDCAISTGWSKVIPTY